MAKTGSDGELGTAEGASFSRAAYSIHMEDPVFDDSWAVELQTPENQRLARDPFHYASDHAPGRSRFAPIAAAGMGCLRYAEDQVEAAAAAGVRQYVVLGAGLDTFALRRGDLECGLRVYEVDHPDVQALKRERLAVVARRPNGEPEFVPVDFEVTSLAPELRKSSFDEKQPAVFSFLNTVPYLSVEAVRATLAELASLAAPGSRLILNYATSEPLSEAQLQLVTELARDVEAMGESFHSRFRDDEMRDILAEAGFEVRERLDEAGLAERYFAGRDDGWRPGLPLRLVLAERRAD